MKSLRTAFPLGMDLEPGDPNFMLRLDRHRSLAKPLQPEVCKRNLKHLTLAVSNAESILAVWKGFHQLGCLYSMIYFPIHFEIY